jgi:hypothetical protein
MQFSSGCYYFHPLGSKGSPLRPVSDNFMFFPQRERLPFTLKKKQTKLYFFILVFTVLGMRREDK